MAPNSDDKKKLDEMGRTGRNSGLAYGAGISLVGAVVVMLGVGWVIDAYFDSSPIGVVGGILVGAVIGFYQFFRITARILKD